jgi:sulfoxide reductase heme-binding subunit YedZ
MPREQTLRRFWQGFGAKRALTHGVLALATLFGIYLTTRYRPRGEAIYIFTIGFGYISIVFLGLTLLIGPINLLRKRLNPVNIDLRRDVGIWAGITGVLHVVFALLERNRGDLLRFFFLPDGRPLLTLSGASNWIGLAATVLLILLLALSNAYSLHKLKGKRWKKLQRLNYVLTALALMHAFGYQMATGREREFINATAVLVVALLVVQLAGVWVYQRRKVAHRTNISIYITDSASKK